MTYEELLKDYGSRIGIQDIEVDDRGAVFELDDFPIVVRPDEPSQRIAMMAEIGEIGSERQGDIAAKLLKLSFATALNGGMSVAASEDTGKYYCMTSLPLAGLDAERFELELAALARKGRAARDLLQTEAQLEQSRQSREQTQALAGEATIRI
jgi:hypothetical protein